MALPILNSKKRLNNILRCLFMLFLFCITSVFLVNEFLFDLKGLSIKGLYICEGKRIKDVQLDQYYSPAVIYNNAMQLGFRGNLGVGFGEPDSDGSGVHIIKTVKNRTYDLVLSRVKDLEWKKINVTHLIITNSCTTPNIIIRRDIKQFSNDLGIKNQWIYKAKITYDYNLPWFKFEIW